MNKLREIFKKLAILNTVSVDEAITAIQTEILACIPEEKGKPGDAIPVDDIRNGLIEGKGYINGHNSARASIMADLKEKGYL